jgi:hypothetical protein
LNEARFTAFTPQLVISSSEIPIPSERNQAEIPNLSLRAQLCFES